jgi:hypothetical protein
MARYAQYLFNIRHNTYHVIIEQSAHLNAYEKLAAHTSRELERMGHENHILCQGTFGIMVKDLELQVAYRRSSEAEHGLNFTCLQLELTREEVDTRTQAIVHLEDIVEMQDLELDDRAEQIATLVK